MGAGRARTSGVATCREEARETPALTLAWGSLLGLIRVGAHQPGPRLEVRSAGHGKGAVSPVLGLRLSSISGLAPRLDGACR